MAKTAVTVPIRKAQVLRIIRRNSPTTPEAFKKLGLRMKPLGAGVFRRVFRIGGCDLVVKFPLSEDSCFAEGIQHSVSEIKRIERLSRIDELKPHLPKIFYFDRKNGIIVMQYYPELKDGDGVDFLGKVVRKLVSRIGGVTMGDIHEGNIRLKRKGWEQLVFTDLGY